MTLLPPWRQTGTCGTASPQATAPSRRPSTRRPAPGPRPSRGGCRLEAAGPLAACGA